MKLGIAKAGLVIAALGLAGCTEATLQSATTSTGSGPKAERALPATYFDQMKIKGMSRNAPIMARIFKEEGKVEIWKQKINGRYDLIAMYDLCKWSGKLGPKFTEGDRQAPEGFYIVRPGQMNPNSSYHLAFNIGYPNAYDRAHGRTGTHLMVHGACSSSGCYAVTDQEVEQIYAFARDAFRGGQTEFQIQAFPFRMTAENMARYRDDPNYAFWKNLKEGYDHFEITRVPPKVDVCEKRYVFNRVPEGTKAFSPTGSCPPTTQPDSLVTAFQTYQSTYDAAFASYSGKRNPAPAPSIAGIKEASLIADWSKRRSRGERVPIEPPSLASDGATVLVSERMGRIDSPAGRKMAALEAAQAEKKRIAEEKAAAIALKAAEAKAAKLAAAEAKKADEQSKQAAMQAAAVPPPAPAVAEAPAEKAEATGLLGSMRKRLASIF